MQASGQSGYVGFYYWNNGSPELMLFLRNGGNWKQLGSTYNSGALAAGTQLQVTAAGSTISLLVNGVARVTATDSTLTGGVPGILASGAADAGAWSGGSVGSGSGGTTYSVGGTVSGLSGTVVLQDNGGGHAQRDRERLVHVRVPQLAGGAAYAVTVQIQSVRADAARCLAARARWARLTSPMSRSAALPRAAAEAAGAVPARR